MSTRTFSVGNERLLLAAPEDLVRIAGRLWEEGAPDGAPTIRLDLSADLPFEPPAGLPESHLAWTHGEDAFEERLPGLLEVRIVLATAAVSGRFATELPALDEGLASRTLLESPCAVLLARRGFLPLHAGAVTGPRGAVVLRGPSGAGKSTLVAACWKAGLGVLGDESVLVSRADHDELAASVRDLTILPDACRLLDLEERTEPAFAGGEAKRRVPLLPDSTPLQRRARRVGTFLLGDRESTVTRLVPLDAEELALEFERGTIPEERRLADPSPLAVSWQGSTYRLDGASDLDAAVALLRDAVGNP